MMLNSFEGIEFLLKEGKLDSAKIAAESLEGPLSDESIQQSDLNTVLDLLMAGHSEAAKQILDFLILDELHMEIQRDSLDGIRKLLRLGKANAARIATASMMGNLVDLKKYFENADSNTVTDLLMGGHIQAADQLMDFWLQRKKEPSPEVHYPSVSDILRNNPDLNNQLMAYDLYRDYFGDSKKGVSHQFFDQLAKVGGSTQNQLDIINKISRLVDSNLFGAYQIGYKRAIFSDFFSQRLKRQDEDQVQLKKALERLSSQSDHETLSKNDSQAVSLDESIPKSIASSMPKVEDILKNNPDINNRLIAYDLYKDYFGDSKEGINKRFLNNLKKLGGSPKNQLAILNHINTLIESNFFESYQMGYKRSFILDSYSGRFKKQDEQLQQLRRLERRIYSQLETAKPVQKTAVESSPNPISMSSSSSSSRLSMSSLHGFFNTTNQGNTSAADRAISYFYNKYFKDNLSLIDNKFYNDLQSKVPNKSEQLLIIREIKHLIGNVQSTKNTHIDTLNDLETSVIAAVIDESLNGTRTSNVRP